jgi:signal transduction histidine kinase
MPGTHQTRSVSLPDEAIWIEADRTRLLQVFANLLTNATKYTQDGGRVGLSAETMATPQPLFGSRTTGKVSHLVCFPISLICSHRRKPLIPADWASD